jgi:hypothetical protein
MVSTNIDLYAKLPCNGRAQALPRSGRLEELARSARRIDPRSMAAFIIGIFAVLVWTAGLADWIVAYATGMTQLGIWITALSLVPFASLWLSLKTEPFSAFPVETHRAHWSLFMKS